MIYLLTESLLVYDKVTGTQNIGNKLMKRCMKCGIEKELDAYYKHPAMADGHLNKCKECTKTDVRKNREENKDHYVEFEKKRAMAPHRVEMRKKYLQTDAGKKAKARGIKSYHGRYHFKYVAHNLTYNAIRNGKLIRLPCEECGNEKSQAHHDDYSKPLSVRWLCTTHHRAWHRTNKAIYPF